MLDDFSAEESRNWLLENAFALRLDGEMRIVEANAPARRMLGDEVLGRLWSDALGGAADRLRFRFFPLAGGTLALGSVDLAELPLLREEGRRLAEQQKSHAEALRQQSLASLNLLEDALEAQRRIAASEARARAIFKGAPEAAFIVYPGGRCVELNAITLPRYGYTREEFLAMQPADLVAPACVAEFNEQLERARHRAVRFESRHRRKDGSEFPVDMSVSPLVLDGLDCLLCTARDSSERKAAEAALRRSELRYGSILEAAPDAIVLSEREGRIVLVNTQAENMFGEPRQALLGRSIEQLFPERLHPELAAQRAASLAGEPAPKTLPELFGVRRDGSEFPVEMTLSVLDSDEGALFFSAIRDVTDRKKAEQRSRQLEILAAEAEAANKAKSMFISTMSHEIRTPLNAIIGYSQLLLRDEGLTPEAKGNLKIINRSGEHLLHMVNESLDLAKIEAGREQLAPRSFDLPGLLRDLEAMFRLRAEAKKLELSVNLAGVPLQYVVADDGKIRQVLINLLANALKFTDRGRIALQVSLSPAPDGGLRLIAQVADTGCGMTAEEQAALFQPFVQGRAGRRARDGGSGLGLAISQKVAQLLGGAIAVTSTLGQGSTFVLDIPVERSKARDFHKHSGPGKRVVGLKPGQERPRILIVDDRPDNRDWLSQLLNALGFSARSAEDGEGAIQLSRQWSPHLILMDMHMPGMNGLEATRQIKAHPSGAHTVVIALTADAMDGYRRFVVKTEVSDFIIKPCAENELLEKIGKHLGLEYLYQDGTLDETKEWEEPAGLTALNRAMVRELPGQLVEQLRLATLVGDKTQLDELIREAGETGNPQTARALQALADEYQYDNLIRLLEGTWPK